MTDEEKAQEALQLWREHFDFWGTELPLAYSGYGDCFCFFCDAPLDDPDDPHKDDCVWIRAKRLLGLD